MINICRTAGNWRQHGNVFLNSASEELYCRGQHREVGRTGSTPHVSFHCALIHTMEINSACDGPGPGLAPRSPHPLLVTKPHDPFLGVPFEVHKQLITNFLDARL